MVTIRHYRDEDEASVIALVRELQAHELVFYELMKPPGDIGSWYVQLMRERCGKEAGHILVAEDGDGVVVGYAAVMTECSSTDEIDEVPYSFGQLADLMVAAQYRGRGIGRKLIDACEEIARAAGRSEFRIGVLARNDRAHGVYRRLGFADHHITMRKRLA
jgi:ribosomal protein S18 acetylase RimI-like enzyme